ncbi:MAG: hypothetical protein ACLR3C_17330, partial [Eggerthella lenta]
QLSAGSFADVGYYFDPTHPTRAMADAAATVGAQAPLVWLGAVAVGAIVPLAAAFMGKRSGNWRLWAPVAIVAALAGAVCMRVAFYNLGLSVFMFTRPSPRRPDRRGLRLTARERRSSGANRPAPSAAWRGPSSGRIVSRETFVLYRRMFHVKHPGSALPLRPEALFERGSSPQTPLQTTDRPRRGLRYFQKFH